MARQLFKQVLAMPVFMCLSQVGYTAEHALKTNPFSRSVEVQEQVHAAASRTAAQKDSIPFVLRGTMMAGPQSLANISGVVVSLGDNACQQQLRTGLAMGADRAIQVFGAMGLSPDTPLADLYTAGRALRFADGPDEVHLQTIARLEARDQRDRLMAVLKYLEPADVEPAGEER